MVKRRVIALATGIGLGLVACAQIIGLSDLSEGGDPFDAGGDGTAAGDSGDGASEGGDAQPADLCANGAKDGDETDIDCGGSKCGKCAKGKDCKVSSDCAKECSGGKCVGCAGVELDGGDGPCIDATEVTVAAYFAEYGAQERSHTARDVPAGACTGRVIHPPKGDNPNLPVRSVRWCTASAYCTFVGKHLCRGDEWLSACSGGGTLAYPYGNSFEATRCNDEGEQSTPWDAGSGTNCKTLDPLNVYDLSGNVAEWQNACDAGRDGGGSCAVRGGSYSSASGDVRCDSAKSLDIHAEVPDVGFRCCE